MTDRFVSSYIAEMEERLEAPYRRGVLINFGLWCVIALGGSFYLMVLL